MRVSVVVPTHRRAHMLEPCLDALAAQRHAAAEVIVVARPGDDATLRLLASRSEDSALRTVTVAERRQTYAMNAGARAATGAIVALTDDDARPRPDWLARLVTAYADPSVGAVGGRDHQLGEDGRLVDDPVRRVGTVRWFGRTVGNHHLRAEGRRDVDFLKGVNLSVRRELWRMDHRLHGPGVQFHWELDLCLSIRAAGWRVVFDPAIVVDHFPAPRADEPQRGADPPLAMAHNEALALQRWLSPRRRTVAMAYGLLVGTRVAPGLANAARRTAGGERLGAVTREALLCSRARLAAARRAHDERRRPEAVI